jgi:hypothetical protein
MAQNETWEGGFIRRDRRGRPTFVIRRMIDGVPYKASTRAHNEGAAVAQLRRFEADPGAYSPAGTPRKQPIYLDDKLILEFVKHSRDVRPR